MGGYTIAALFSLLVIFNFFPFVNSKYLVNTIGIFQFTGRFFILPIILTVMGMVLYSDENRLDLYKVIFIVLMSIITIDLEISTNIRNPDQNRYTISNNTWRRVINDYTNFDDYVSKEAIVDMKNHKKLNKVNQTYDSATYMTSSGVEGFRMVPLAMYKGLDYKVYVNNKMSRFKIFKGLLYVRLKDGKNKIKVKSEAGGKCYLLFAVSLLSLLILLVRVVPIIADIF